MCQLVRTNQHVGHGASNTQSLDIFNACDDLQVAVDGMAHWMLQRNQDESSMHNKGSTLYASRASLLSAGTLPLEYLPLSTPDASGLQIVVPTIHICLVTCTARVQSTCPCSNAAQYWCATIPVMYS